MGDGYYYLQKGDIIQPGDESDNVNDGWRDDPRWKEYTGPRIGRPAPDPTYPAHTLFRRRIREPEE